MAEAIMAPAELQALLQFGADMQQTTGFPRESANDPAVLEQLESYVGGAVKRTIRRGEMARASRVKVGLTPKEVVYECGTLRLYHYHARVDNVYRVPLLIVMATTNRGFIFDLLPGQSMVEFLLDRGFDVYMLDWQAPSDAERNLSLADYTQDFIPTCVDIIAEETGESEVSIAGYCQGGVLSLIYAATHPRGPLKNLMLFTTPIDQHKMELARIWSDPRFADVDKLVDTLGNLPANMITTFFNMLRPAQRAAGQYQLWDQALNDDFVISFRALQRWGDEMLPLAGEYYREVTKELMWGNKLFEQTLEVAGKPAKLGNISVPVLHAVAQHDHIVPYESSKPLMNLIGSKDKEEVLLKGGHVSLIAGPRAAGRLWPKIDDWLSLRSM